MYFLGIIDNINERLGRIVGFLIIVLMLIIFSDICGRYFFLAPFPWGIEVDEYILVVIVFLAGGYAFLHNAHVRVDIIYSRFPPRTRAIIDIITSLFIFSLCIVLVWYGFQLSWQAMINDYRACTAVRTPIWPTYFMIPIAGVLLGLQCLAKWIRDWVLVVKGIKLQSKVSEKESIFGD